VEINPIEQPLSHASEVLRPVQTARMGKSILYACKKF
jgi:hypothetical protein